MLLPFAVPLIVFLHLGPAALAAFLAVRSRSRRERWIRWSAFAFAVLPTLAIESYFAGTAFATFDGMCHHAPDIRYPCSRLQWVIESANPFSSPFAMTGFFVLGIPAFVFGAVITGAAYVWTRRSLAP